MSLRFPSLRLPSSHPIRSGSLGPLVLLLTGLMGCASAPVAPAAASAPTAAPTSAAPSELFTFHVSSWINLHQQLFFEARPPPGPLTHPEEEKWTPAERQAWDAAVAAYREHTPENPLAPLYDPGLIALRRGLEDVPEEGSLADLPGVDPALTAALRQAIGPYRAHIWPKTEREARAWVAALEPSLRQSGPAIARELAEVYGAPWPARPFTIQVARYATRFGAYTLVDPAVITVSSHSPPNRKPTPLETVFHEASHELMRPLLDAFHAEFTRQGKPPPRMLWHALLFFTAGEVVRHHLGPDYVPYAHANGLYDRDPEWAAFEPVMRREWIPFLEHKVDLQTALRQLVAGYVPPASAPAAPAP
jgi:hypothetical protein